MHARPGVLLDVELPDYGTFGSATVLIFYGFIGFEGALFPAGESRDPQRDMPRALLWTLGGTTLIYVLVQAVCVMVLPDLATSEKPLAAAAAELVGPLGAAVMGAAAIVSIYGNNASSILTAPRMTYAMARDGGLPRFLAAVHPRWRTPHWSIVAYGVLTFGLAISGSFVWLAGMSTLTRLVGYGLCVAALPRLRRRFGAEAGAFHLPGGFVIPAVALVVCAWLLTQCELDALYVTLAFLLLGALLYAGSRRRAA
jgi:amino acid transporter